MMGKHTLKLWIVSLLAILLEVLGESLAVAYNNNQLIRGERCDGNGTTGGSCDISVGLECSQGMCDCKPGYTISRNGTKCLEIARNGLESPCEESIQCWKSLLGRLSECHIGRNKCSCYESDTLPIVFHQGRCYYGESLGEYCQIEGLCSATTLQAVCKMGVCQCKEGYVPSWDKSRCLPIATQGLNSPCEENIQCEKSPLGTLSECNLERMQCECYQIPMVPMVFHSGRCYFGAGLGDVCQVNPQCSSKTAYSTCGSDGKCRCSVGFIPDQNHTECLAQPELNLNIELDLQSSVNLDPPLVNNEERENNREREMDIAPDVESECYEDTKCAKVYGYFSRCNLSSGSCECRHPDNEEVILDFKPVGSNKTASQRVKCYSTKYLGQGCKFQRQCDVVTLGSKCVNGICECQQDTHVPSEDRRLCLEVAQGLGSMCVEDSQCSKSPGGELSKCHEKYCVCPNSTVEFEGRCYTQQGLGGSCHLDVQCQSENASLTACVDGSCSCGSNSVPTKDGSGCVIRPAETRISYNNSCNEINQMWNRIIVMWAFHWILGFMFCT